MDGQVHASPTFDVIPAIDLIGGRVVRLVGGDFARETTYSGDPVAVAGELVVAGARWLHVVDLDGARAGATMQMAVVRRMVAAVGDEVTVELAGGLRTEAMVDEAVRAGAGRVVLGTVALADPDLVARVVARHGQERVAVALDVRAGRAIGGAWLAAAPGLALGEAVDALKGAGVGTFEVTAIARDGTLEGPDLELLGEVVGRRPGQVIASGGISSVADLLATRDAGCSGAIVGRAIYEGKLDLRSAIEALAGA